MTTKKKIPGNKEQIREKKPKTQKQLDALKPTQFQPGVSGNPSGRPRNILSDAARLRLTQKIPGDKEKRDWAAVAIQALINQCAKGNVTAMALLFDRLEGKAMQAHEVSGPGGSAIPITSMTPEENEKRIAELQARHRGSE